MKSIERKLMLIQSELKCPKTEYNAFGKYYHRNLDSIYEALKPLLLKHSCSYRVNNEIHIFMDQIYRKSIAMLTCIETGEQVTAETFTRESMQHKGMTPEQMSGTTSSYSDKYVASKLFCLDDAKDPDVIEGDDKNEKPKQAAKPTFTVPKDAPDCPQCGGKMILRKSEKGEFYGCSGFPTCRGFVKI